MYQSTTTKDNPASVRRQIRSEQGKIANLDNVKSSKLIRFCRVSLTGLWRRFLLDLDSRCYPVNRKMTSPDPLKPTSLNAQQVSDIWSIQNKL